MSRGYVICMPRFAILLLVYTCTISLYGLCDGNIYISAWGFGVARFDLQGFSQVPQNVKRAIVQGFTLELSFVLYSTDNQCGIVID